MVGRYVFQKLFKTRNCRDLFYGQGVASSLLPWVHERWDCSYYFRSTTRWCDVLFDHCV